MKLTRLLSSISILALGLLLPSLHAGTSGAIFTTDAGGTIVNANVQYNSKCDVYLDGGPGPHAPAKAAGLAAGDYYFQVTDPSGKTLLSTDPVSNRRFTVSTNGVVTAFSGTGGPAHITGVDQDHPELGAVTIRLANTTCPTDYLDSPNNGGVYKVWATRVADFAGDASLVDNSCGNGCFHGFLSSKSKTDDFKVRPTVTTFCATLAKEVRAPDGSFVPRENWEIHLTDSLGVSNAYFTDATGQVKVCDLSPGNYTATEVMSPDWTVFGLFFNGQSLPANASYIFSWSAGNPQPVILFQNDVASSPQ